MDDLKSLVEFMACTLVDDPESVNVEVQGRGRALAIHLTVPESEMGKVIGRQGRIARAMRTLLTIAASKQGLRASLDIND